MAKYIGTYATSGDVQTALDNQELSRPFIAYTTDNDKVYYGPAADRAEAGDIVVYSVSDDLLHYIKQADYNTTSYPSASYVPVGVVAYPQADDAILGPSGEITFMGLYWPSDNNPDTGAPSSRDMPWGNATDISGLTNYANTGTAITDMNGKANTEAVLAYATGQSTWKTDSTIQLKTDPGYFPLFECVWRYHTSGTVQGDWYIPAAGQIYKIFGDEAIYTQVVSGINKIYGAPVLEPNKYFASSTEKDSNSFYRINNYNLGTYGKSSIAGLSRPYCSKLMTRI